MTVIYHHPLSKQKKFQRMKMKQLQKSMLLLPYQGDKDIGLTKLSKINLNKHQPHNVKTQVTLTDQKLSAQFNVKDSNKFEHKHDVIYFGKCPEQNCTDNYIGESTRRISERIIGHGF